MKMNHLFLVRQICPDKNVNGLWDLFEKCNGNAQWVLDILLKDDTSVESIKSPSEVSNFQCNCNNILKSSSNSDLLSNTKLVEQHSKNNILDSPKQKKIKDKSNISDELIKVKQTIENRVIMDASQCSEHFRKIRNVKHSTDNNLNNLIKSSAYNSNQDDNASDELLEASNENEMVEIDLGKEFIEQLEKIFGATQTPVTKNLKTNIFMPKALGEQLYALWMESIYNQLEEEKQETIKKDEEFAILLQSTSHASTINKESYKDILDMELAWSVYKANPDQWKNEGHLNLASFLAHAKLCEMFPDIEKDTLQQILQAHNNSLSETVKALNNSIEENCSDIMNEKKK